MMRKFLQKSANFSPKKRKRGEEKSKENIN
jgi:hypothetical protein